VVNTHEAKSTLSRLLALVEAGEEVVIARGGSQKLPGAVGTVSAWSCLPAESTM